MWTSGFFVSKDLFPYQMFTKSLHFFVTFNIFQKKGSMCLKNSKNKNTHTFLVFDTQTTLSTIIVLNL
jgi:hypothetical protein